MRSYTSRTPDAFQRGLQGRPEPWGISPEQAREACLVLPSQYPGLQEKEGQQNGSSALTEKQWNRLEGKHQAINVKGESGKTK